MGRKTLKCKSEQCDNDDLTWPAKMSRCVCVCVCLLIWARATVAEAVRQRMICSKGHHGNRFRIDSSLYLCAAGPPRRPLRAETQRALACVCTYLRRFHTSREDAVTEQNESITSVVAVADAVAERGCVITRLRCPRVAVLDIARNDVGRWRTITRGTRQQRKRSRDKSNVGRGTELRRQRFRLPRVAIVLIVRRRIYVKQHALTVCRNNNAVEQDEKRFDDKFNRTNRILQMLSHVVGRKINLSTRELSNVRPTVSETLLFFFSFQCCS